MVWSMRRVSTLLCAILLAASATAAEPAARPDADPTLVELPTLVAPVTVDGRLYHYAYMRVLLKTRDTDIAWIARDKVPFLIDAFLRETHRATIALGGDPKQIDGDALKKRLRDAANGVLGAGAVEEVRFQDTIAVEGVPTPVGTPDEAVSGGESPPKSEADHAATH